MSRTNYKPQFSTTLHLLRRAVTCMTVALMVITCAVLTAPVEALALQTSPSALSFTGTQGGADPAAQSVTLWKRSDSTRSWTASVSASWLTVSPMSGSISSERDQVSVDVSLSGLPAGNHSSNVIIIDVGPNGGTRRTVLPVSLTVSSPISTSSFNLSPPSLAFSGTAGGASPAAQTFGVSNTGSGTLSWAASDSAGWLVLSPMSGTNNGSVTANVNLTGLAAGTYNTAISVTAPGATTKTVPVALTVTAPAIPEIGLSPASLTFTAAAGGTNPAPQPVTISNSGTGTLSWTASDNTAWLTLSPVSGTNTGTVNASVNLTGLAAGTYNTAITVTAPGATTKTVPVALTVTAPTTPAIQLSPASLTFTGTAGGANPAPKTFSIFNTGGGTLTWTASDTAGWLILSPASGTNTGTVTASIAANGLAAGTYTTTVTVSAPGATAKTIPVTLTITAASTNASLWSSPGPPSFAGTVGGPIPSAQTLTINSTGGPLNWTVSNNASWLSISSSSGSTPGSLTLTVNPTGLAAGTYNGLLTITAPAATNSPHYVPVTLTITATSSTPAIGFSPASLAFSGVAGAANPAAQLIGISNTGSGTLAWTASDNAAWLILTPTSGTNTGTMTASVNTTGLAAGTYNTTVSVAATGTTTKTLPVTLTLNNSSPTSGVTITPSPVAFSGTVGPGPLTIPVIFTNVGAASVSFTWTDSISWITAGQPAGTLSPGQSVTYNMNAKISGMAAGSYSGTATVTAGGVSKQVSVTLTLSSGSLTPAIGLNTTTLGFAGTVGGTNPSAQTIAVSNVGGGTLSWTTSDNAAWLTLSPVSGTNSGTVTASVNLTGLAAGTYNAIITVTAAGVPAKTLPVTLTITATTAGATIGFSPTSLTFTGTVGGTNPAAKPISISNTGGGTLSWTASDNAAWLALSPVSGSNSGTVTANVNMTGLAAGTYNGIITIAASGSTNSPRQIPVSFTLTASTAGTATLTWNASTESDLTGYKVYRGTGSGTYGAPLATLPKTTTNYAATGLQNGTTYFFVITAYDSAGNESPYSNEVSKSIF